MSKSKGNVVNPDDVIQINGTDTLRLYEMFMGPLEATKPWSTTGVDGAHRFLNRVWRLIINEEGILHAHIKEQTGTEDFERVWHQTIKKVSEDMEGLRFNTAISQLMVFVNEAYKQEVMPKAAIKDFLIMLSPITPHIAEELWSALGHKESIAYQPWPNYDEAKLVQKEVEIVIQFKGKIRFRKMVPVALSKEELEKLVLGDSSVQEEIKGQEVRKVIVVPGKLVNIVV